MLKIISCAVFFRTNNSNTPFEEGIKSLVGIILKVPPVTFDKTLELSEEPLYYMFCYCK